MKAARKARRPVILPTEIWGSIDKWAVREDREWGDMTRVLIKESLERRERAVKRGPRKK